MIFAWQTTYVLTVYAVLIVWAVAFCVHWHISAKRNQRAAEQKREVERRQAAERRRLDELARLSHRRNGQSARSN